MPYFNLRPHVAILISTVLINACGSGGGSSSASTDPVNTRSVGKKLFFDTSLSSNGNQSCASCHDPASGFADPDVTSTAPVSEGSVANAFGNRNAPTSAYAAFIPDFERITSSTDDGTVSQFRGGQFLDGRSIDLIEQAKAPFLNPMEMNNSVKADVVSKVSQAAYASEFRHVFGENIFSDTDMAYDKIAIAIASFEASSEMNPFSSKFDAVMEGQTNFTLSEQRGFDLFKGTKAKCANCHTVNSPNAEGSLFTDFNYFNIGTPVNTDNPAYVDDNSFRDGGLGDSPIITDAMQQAAQAGKFRTPTLRNIELTAPYMHNGVYQTLEEVIRHYDIQIANEFVIPEINANIANELNAGSFMGLDLQPQDYTDLENFMLTLTDGYY